MDTTVSPAVAMAFAAWREAHIDMIASAGRVEDIANAAQTKAGDLLVALMGVPCSASGDGMVKSYVHLRGECGEPVDGSMFDIDLREFVGNGTHVDAWMHGLYADLDRCDLGMCLLGLGHIAFCASSFMDACDRDGLPVYLMVNAAGEQALWIGRPDVESDAQRRQHCRLRRLLSAGHQHRDDAVVLHIRQTRGDRMIVAEAARGAA